MPAPSAPRDPSSPPTAKYYYPKVLVHVTATVAMNRKESKTEDCGFAAIPLSITLERNDFNQADTCQLEFDSSVFPVLPRNMRQALVQVYLGDTGGLDFDLQEFAQAKNLLFLGYVDTPELSLSETDGKISWKARDYTALFLDAKRPAASLIPSYQDDLGKALRRILDAAPGGEALRLRLMENGEKSREWPELAEGAPPGLAKAKIPTSPNDSLWDLIKRACEVVGLVPSFVLDTLVVSTSRGFDPPPKTPFFIYGENLTEFHERRHLTRVREGIAVSGYDLSKKRHIVAAWPPAGDADIAKKADKKIATGKAGSKKKVPPTVGATGTKLDPNDKRHFFAYGAVPNEDALLEVAKNAYEMRASREFEGSFTTSRMRVWARNTETGNTEPIDRFDVVRLTSGDRVVIDVNGQTRQLLASLGDQSRDSSALYHRRVELLVSRGVDRSVAGLLVRSYEQKTERGLEVYVRSVRMSLSDGEGFRLSVDFQNLIDGGGA